MLRRRDAGEADRRLTVLTAENGVIDILAKGARRPGSRFSGSSEPLSVAVFHLAKGKVNEFITQAQPISSFPGLRTDFDRLSLALAVCEIAVAVLPHEQESPAAFRLVVEAFTYLEAHEKPLVAFAWAQLALMQIAGLSPRWDRCVVCDQTVEERAPGFSPHAGGILHEACSQRFTDRFTAPLEIAITLRKMQALAQPPSSLKLAFEACETLSRFWHSYGEAPLPALRAAMSAIRPSEL